MNKQGEKVIVGMSGGVDSTVVAALLKKEGYDVEGVFLKFWKDEKNKESFESAKKMAGLLNIPLFKVIAEKDFKKKIVNKFIDSYRDGYTPNPCVVCNPEMKFDILLKEMNKRDADFVATGHYANTKGGKLFKAKDKSKDQSYFLYGLKSNQLDKIIFPLGKYLKSQVRKIAEEMDLEVANRDESQDICFVAQNNFDDFLNEHIEINPGKIEDVSGKVLGKHKGLHFYTIGQRKGINLGGDGPYYVVKKNIKKNLLIVSNEKDKKTISRDSFEIKSVNWIAKDIEFPLKTKTKIRYGSNPVYATILKVGSREKIYNVKFDESQKAITPGQSAVFYDNEKVLGGGIIV
jgi:tRNA-uridine 2-sulfurtransferase